MLSPPSPATLLRSIIPWSALLLVLAVLPGPPGGVLPPVARGDAPPLAVGVHAPNRPWQDEDFARVAKGGFGAVVMMSYHPLASYVRLREARPDMQFVVRLDTPWNELPAPEQFAATNGAYLRTLIDAGLTPWVEIGNEPNLELHPNAEASFTDWYLVVLRDLRQVVPEARYGFPALAPDRREDEWLRVAAPAIEASDWLAVHAYWRSATEMLDPKRGLRLMDVHERFPQLPLVVTEAGNEAPNVTAAERASEYARFTRTLAQLPYVRAVDFFILSGTPEWRRFFFDDALAAAVRGTTIDPTLVLDGVRAGGQWMLAFVKQLFAPAGHGLSAPPERPPVQPTPTPVPTPVSLRRRLLADAAPATGPRGRWVTIDANGGEGTELRTRSTFLGTDFSVRLDLPAPERGQLEAVQFATGMLAPNAAAGTGGVPTHPATGFTLLGDGARWRLQYWREGALVTEQTFAGPVTEPDGRVAVEMALERRSAAAWVWAAGTPQPDTPLAVFAPPESAALDGAQPRWLFIPRGAGSLVLEGATRD